MGYTAYVVYKNPEWGSKSLFIAFPLSIFMGHPITGLPPSSHFLVSPEGNKKPRRVLFYGVRGGMNVEEVGAS